MIGPSFDPADPRLAAEAAPVGLLLLDAGGATLFANARATAILATDCPTPDLADAIRPDARSALAEQLAGVIAGDGASVHDHPGHHPGGQDRWLRIWTSPVTDEQGEVRGVVVALDDITRDRRGQRDQRLESLGHFAGRFAHDLNNLLTGILGNLSLAQLELPEGSEGAELLGDAQDSAERAAQLAARLLGFGGRGAPATGTVDLDAVARRTVEARRAELAPGVRLEAIAGAPGPVDGDASRLSAALSQLLDNAIEALEGRGGSVRVRTGAATVDAERKAALFLDAGLPEGPAIVLEVIDTGVGMVDAVKERMLEPFYSTRGRDRGLGHALTVTVLRAHRAGLEVESVAGAGTTVRLLLRPRDTVVENPAPTPMLVA